MTSQPKWAPLEARLPLGDCAGWMWMHSSEFDGRTVEHYKHRDTRGYLNLDQDGNAWRFRKTEWGCGPFCDEQHEHIPDPPPVAEPMSFDQALQWALS